MLLARHRRIKGICGRRYPQYFDNTEMGEASMKTLRLMAPVFAALSVVSVSVHAESHDVSPLVVTVCSKCHGIDGNSISPRYPKLAGQPKAYLVSQMKAFRDGVREDKDGHLSMWAVAKMLTDEVAGNTANYFSSQKTSVSVPDDTQTVMNGRRYKEHANKAKELPACGGCHARKELDDKMALKAADYFATQIAAESTPGDVQLVANGKEIYMRGIKDKNVPACGVCHARAGRGYAIVPRLAGQLPEYLVSRLKASHIGTGGRPKASVTIETNVEKLSDEEVLQVTAYLQGL
jgi:cytochrome c553